MTAEAPQSPRCDVSLSMPARMKGRWMPASQPGARPVANSAISEVRRCVGQVPSSRRRSPFGV